MRGFLFAAIAAVVPQAASAQQGIDLAAAFGAREGVEQMSLSPDGTQIAFVAPTSGQGSAILVSPVDGSAPVKTIIRTSQDGERLGGCRWAAAQRLVCTLYMATKLDTGDVATATRQVSLNSDGSDAQIIERTASARDIDFYDLHGGSIIDWLPDQDGKVLMTRDFAEEVSTGSNLAASGGGRGVVQVDTRTMSTKLVERPDKDAVEYLTDGLGNVRIKGEAQQRSGYDTGLRTYLYRAKTGGGWKPLSKVGGVEAGFDPYGIDAATDVAYGLKMKDGRSAAYKMSLDGSATETLLFAHPDVDVDGFASIGRRGRIIGVTYATDRRHVQYFDADLAKLARSLSRAIPNLPLIRFVDSSVDESKLLISASSDVDPGKFFLFDRASQQLSEVLSVRPQLQGVSLGTMKAISYPAADGTMIPGYLTLPAGKADAKGLPAIVMPHGGPGARDEWGFDWLAQYFVARGYAVLQPNFRGSAGYGEDWFVANGFKSWKTAIGDVNDGARWLVKDGGADAAKLSIVGWSYGGYAALQSAVTEPDLFKAVVAIAPVTDLEMVKAESRNFTDRRVTEDFIGSGPHIAEGSPARHAAKIKAPVMLVHGTLDANVGIDQTRRMETKLKEAGKAPEVIIYDKLDHYLEDAQARTQMLKRADDFIRKAIGT